MFDGHHLEYPLMTLIWCKAEVIVTMSLNDFSKGLLTEFAN